MNTEPPIACFANGESIAAARLSQTLPERDLMTRGTFTHRHQVAGRGAFASITLETHPCEIPLPIRTAAGSDIAWHYLDAARTGIHYAYTQLLVEGQSLPPVEVTILELLDSPCDTTELLIVYVAANAFCDSLGLSLRNSIEIDTINSRLSFAFGCPIRPEDPTEDDG